MGERERKAKAKEGEKRRDRRTWRLCSGRWGLLVWTWCGRREGVEGKMGRAGEARY